MINSKFAKHLLQNSEIRKLTNEKRTVFEL